MQSYKAANANIVTARAEMTTQGADIVTISDKLYDIQLERRDAESTQARSLQLISTLLALLVGVIAAWVITRQITRPIQDTLAVVERIASGDLSHNIQVTRRDELGACCSKASSAWAPPCASGSAAFANYIEMFYNPKRRHSTASTILRR